MPVCMVFFHMMIFSMSYNLSLLQSALILYLKMDFDINMVFKVKSCHQVHDILSQLLSKMLSLLLYFLSAPFTELLSALTYSSFA